VKVQVVGLPLTTHRRLKNEAGDWATALGPDHVFRSSPSSAWPSIGQAEIADIRANVREGFAHIIVMPMRAWEVVRNSFRFDCRVVMARFTQEVEDLDWAFLKGVVSSLIDFEERWASRIRPKDVHDPLLLPPPTFEPARNVSNFWSNCDVYGKLSLIDDAQKVLAKVSKIHRKGRGAEGHSWVDTRGRQFKCDPSRHGRSKDEREGYKQFRFCFEVPEGFHYDVNHVSANEFWVTDLDRKTYRVRRANIDPWGRIR
jgi:hypothetical protein